MLRLKRLAQNSGAHAALCQQDFDDEVIAGELARDIGWKKSGGARIVETWHPGNFAYALKRRSQISPAAFDSMRAATCGAFVLPLRINKETALVRMREKSPGVDDEKMAEFFLAVAACAEQIAREWGAVMLPALDTDEQTPEQSAAAAIELAARYGINTVK